LEKNEEKLLVSVGKNNRYQKGRLLATAWQHIWLSKGLPACVSVAAHLAPVGLSNRYQRMPYVAGKMPGVLDRR